MRTRKHTTFALTEAQTLLKDLALTRDASSKRPTIALKSVRCSNAGADI